MSKIKILSEHLANQIAAGEVIERPASVLKEFLENSLDAAARHIEVQVEGDGTRLIRVVDDGIGMDSDDVLLCLERHATSKLLDTAGGQAQLAGISTLGFRGEAIPSIASVSRLTITSRQVSDSLGSRVEVKYGRVVKVLESGGSQGTVVEMRDLFGNVPARKKFLKSRRTELAHLEDMVRNCCLARPLLGVTFQVDSKMVFDLPSGADTLEARVRWFLKRRRDEPLIKVDGRESDAVAADNGGAPLLTGFLLPPDEVAGLTAQLKIFVNGRVVRDKIIAHGVGEGLGGFLMKGRTAAGVLFLTIDPEAVDVNVHPTKQEVRFDRAPAIHKYVSRTVRAAILAFQQDMKFSLFGSPPVMPQEKGSVQLTTGRSTAARQQARDAAEGVGALPSTAEPESLFLTGVGEHGAAALYRTGQSGAGVPSTGVSAPSNLSEDRIDPATLLPIGQLMNLYILCRRRGGGEEALVVIDQHAAHERLIFETLKKQFAAQRVVSQALLFPQLVDFTRDQVQILKQHRGEIERLGLEVEEFGNESYVLKAVPAILASLAPEEIMGAVLEQFQDSGAGSSGRLRDANARMYDIMSSMACKAAVKAGRSLAPREIDDFLQQMREADVFSHCPHGRPVMKMFTAADIKRWFHRT